MIDGSRQNTTLKVCLDDAGTHNRAILDFFFAKIGRHIFRCVETQEAANVLLIDYDFPPARQRYEAEYQHWGKPALVLSISEVSLANAIWLAKPLTSRSLLDAADTLKQGLSAPISAAAKPADITDTAALNPENAVLQRPPAQRFAVPPPLPLVDRPAVVTPPETAPISAELPHSAAISDESAIVNDTDESLSDKADAESNTYLPDHQLLPPQTLSAQTSTPAAEPSQVSEPEVVFDKPVPDENDERILWLCGDSPDIPQTIDFKDFHQEDTFFLSSLKDAIRLARQCQQGVLLNFPKARIYVLPEIHRIFCGIDIHDDEFTELISSCNVHEGGKMHILSTEEIHELNGMISQQASALFDLESFVWTATLLSAKGSLPRTLDPGKQVGLRHWPSLTRLESFPHVMPIAAQWSDKAMSAFDVAKSLSIPQRYVFSFYNAANSLGLIEQDPEKLISKQSAPRAKDAPRGLFSRLLKRLAGG